MAGERALLRHENLPHPPAPLRGIMAGKGMIGFAEGLVARLVTCFFFQKKLLRSLSKVLHLMKKRIYLNLDRWWIC